MKVYLLFSVFSICTCKEICISHICALDIVFMHELQYGGMIHKSQMMLEWIVQPHAEVLNTY